jgi:zinc transport system ATP-binding protein
MIDIGDLDFAYGQRLVLKHINLAVESGTTLGVIGPNGGGKTTLVRLLLGLLSPTRGQISVGQMSPAAAVGRGDLIGYLPQHPQAPENFPLNVRQFVRLGLCGKTGLLNPYTKMDLESVESVLAKVGITELADEPVGRLSGGQLQRVFMARALAPRPKALLLDEPMTGIDSSGQEKFVQFLRDLKKEMGLTLILISHDLRTVAELSDRVACLNVTLHYHDVPGRLPAELAAEWFGVSGSLQLTIGGQPQGHPPRAGASNQ